MIVLALKKIIHYTTNRFPYRTIQHSLPVPALSAKAADTRNGLSLQRF
jgi:hypothetical protein